MSVMKKIMFLVFALLLVNCSVAMASASSQAVSGQQSVKIIMEL